MSVIGANKDGDNQFCFSAKINIKPVQTHCQLSEALAGSLTCKEQELQPEDMTGTAACRH